MSISHKFLESGVGEINLKLFFFLLPFGQPPLTKQLQIGLRILQLPILLLLILHPLTLLPNFFLPQLPLLPKLLFLLLFLSQHFLPLFFSFFSFLFFLFLLIGSPLEELIVFNLEGILILLPLTILSPFLDVPVLHLSTKHLLLLVGIFLRGGLIAGHQGFESGLELNIDHPLLIRFVEIRE